MVLLDFSQICLSNLMVQTGNGRSPISEDLVRHMILNSLRAYNKKYRGIFGELVIACDSKNYWRKEVFPYYKGSRKKMREKSSFDWKGAFENISLVKEELKEVFPHKVMEVDGCEADDIIGFLGLTKSYTEKVMIVSGDEDFCQLQGKGIFQLSQYSPIVKKELKIEDPAAFLKEHIIQGDSGDGVPNILSRDEVLITEGLRQNPITKKKLAVWLNQAPEVFCETEEMFRNWKRNKFLIDLTEIPLNIIERISQEWEIPRRGNKQALLNYLMKHRMGEHIKVLDEF